MRILRWLSDQYRKMAKKHIPPIFIILVMCGLIISILGLRDVVVTPILTSYIRIVTLKRWLSLFYWSTLILSTLYLLLYMSTQFPTFSSFEGLKELGVWFLLASPFLFMTIRYRLFNDFWLDELISIVRHILTSVRGVIFSYPAPNNHVFANLFLNVYLQIFGWHNARLLFDAPYILRIPLLLSGLGAIFAIAYLVQINFGKWSGRLAVLLTCTTIPLLNFIVQVRGYSFTLLFGSLMLLLVSLFIQDPSRWITFGVIAISALLIYTIPSNIYFVLAVLVYFFIMGYVEWRKGSTFTISFHRDKFLIINPALTLVLMICLGFLLGLIFYIPVIGKVLTNKYVTTSGLLQGTAIIHAFPETLDYFVSCRWWIFVPAWIGLLFGWIKSSKVNYQQTFQLILLSLCVFIFSFIFSFIRGDDPFPRIFLVTYPAFIFLTVSGLNIIIRWMICLSDDNSWVLRLVFAVLFVSAYVMFFVTYRRIARGIYISLEEQNIPRVELNDNRLWDSHFLDHYRVRHVIDAINNQQDTLPVLVDKNNTRYEWVVLTYLRVYEISHQNILEPEEISIPEAYLIVSYPEKSLTDLRSKHPKTECHPITDQLSIYRAYHCQFFEAHEGS